METTNCVSALVGCRHDTNEATTMTAECKFLKKVNDNECKYPDVSFRDRSNFNLNFSSELCKRVRHLSMRLPLLGGFGRPRIWTPGRVWPGQDLKG